MTAVDFDRRQPDFLPLRLNSKTFSSASTPVISLNFSRRKLSSEIVTRSKSGTFSNRRRGAEMNVR
jgi:hypothetical protein